MSDLRVYNLKGRTEGSAPNLPDGAVVTGVVTATSFAGNITGTTGTFTGNVSVGGTLTYDDVTRIDSVGIVTAGGGLYGGRTEGVGTGIGATFTTAGNAILAGGGLYVGRNEGVGTGIGATFTTAGDAILAWVVTATSFAGDGGDLTGLNIPAGWNWVDGSLF